MSFKNTEDFDIEKVIESLKNKKMFFSCEREFQFELAWCIKEEYPASKIKFEYNWNGKEKEAIDIIVILNNKWYPIELKYPTNKCNVEFNGFTYRFSQSGKNEVRYNYLKDIQRIEKLKTKENFGKGYALLLTYDLSYQIDNSDKDYQYNNFSIHNRTINAKEKLTWPKSSSKLKSKHYQKPLSFQTEVSLEWNKNFNTFKAIVNNKHKSLKFEYLLVEIPK